MTSGSAIELTKGEARRFLLAHQGLWPPYQLQGKSGVHAFIRRVGCIQFDPLNIVSQSPELVLQSRVSDFSPQMLKELLYTDRILLDGWEKNMAIYCVEDWPYFRRRREAYSRHPGKSPDAVDAILPQVRSALEERGPLSSIDLSFGQIVDWAWAPTRLSRAALESMYFWGELIIHHKIGTRKVYDFAHRLLPEELLAAADPNETQDQYHDWYVLRRIGSVGLLWNRTSDAWLGVPARKIPERQSTLARLLDQGIVLEVHAEGIGVPLYLRAQEKALLDQTLNSCDPLPQAAILAPLDNLLWDRRLVKELFGFDYRWEVYKPVAERRYGYYVLPVLYGDRLVARFEPGYDKKRGVLTIKQWWWEPDVDPSEELRFALRCCFVKFVAYLGGSQMLVSAAAEQAGLEWLGIPRPSSPPARPS